MLIQELLPLMSIPEIARLKCLNREMRSILTQSPLQRRKMQLRLFEESRDPDHSLIWNQLETSCREAHIDSLLWEYLGYNISNISEMLNPQQVVNMQIKNAGLDFSDNKLAQKLNEILQDDKSFRRYNRLLEDIEYLGFPPKSLENFICKNTVVKHEFNYCMMPKVPNIYFKRAHTVKGSLTVEKVHLIDMGYKKQGDDYVQYDIYLYHAVNPDSTSTMNTGFQVQVSLPLYKKKQL